LSADEEASEEYKDACLPAKIGVNNCAVLALSPSSIAKTDTSPKNCSPRRISGLE
jgi:hypothetical protein